MCEFAEKYRKRFDYLKNLDPADELFADGIAVDFYNSPMDWSFNGHIGVCFDNGFALYDTRKKKVRHEVSNHFSDSNLTAFQWRGYLSAYFVVGDTAGRFSLYKIDAPDINKPIRSFNTNPGSTIRKITFNDKFIAAGNSFLL